MASFSDAKWIRMLYTSCHVTLCDKENSLMGFFTVYYLRAANGMFAMLRGWAANYVVLTTALWSDRALCRSKKGSVYLPLEWLSVRPQEQWVGQWGQQGHSLQQKPDWKFPEKRRGLSAAWSRSKPWSWDKNKFSRNQRGHCEVCSNPEATKPADWKGK